MGIDAKSKKDDQGEDVEEEAAEVSHKLLERHQ